MDTPTLELTPVTDEAGNVVEATEEVSTTPQTPVTDFFQANVNAERPAAVFGSQLTALNRRSEKDPHFFGSVKVNGLWYQTATWINVKEGVQNLQTAYTLMNTEQAAQAEEREAKFQAERLARANPLSAPPVNPLAKALEDEKKSGEVNANDPL